MFDCDYDYEDFCFVTSPTKKLLNEDNEPQWVFRRFGSCSYDREYRGRIRGTIELTHFCFCAFAGWGKPCWMLAKANTELYFL